MKILHVSTYDIEGGAARAAYRLHKSLQREGIDSRMLVQIKKSDNYSVISLSDTKIKKFINLIRPTIDQLPVKFYKKKSKTLFSPAWVGVDIVKKIKEINPDIVHLHWICRGFVKIEDLVKIRKPIVWSLHDMWTFTGGCHYDEGCGGYLRSCGNCKVLGSQRSNDLSKKVFKRKEKVFKKIENMTIISLSSWLKECSENSSLLKDKKHVNIPNLIDIDIFKPVGKEIARYIWNLPKDKKLILFGAVGAINDIRKGFKELKEALHILKRKYIELIVFGSGKPKNVPDLKFKTHYIGYLYDDVSLVTLYSCADVMVVPSLQEAFGQTAIEAMSCSIPVVAFATTGLLDIVDHKINGYLARPYKSEDLAKGIEWILNLNEEKYNKLCENARKKVLKNFDSKIVVTKYIELYKKVLNINKS